MIEKNGLDFQLNTKHTTYAFGVCETGQLEHIYYGRRITAPVPVEKHFFQPGNSIIQNQEHINFTLNSIMSEMPSEGRGDSGSPAVELTFSDKSMTADFKYKSYQIENGLKTRNDNALPGAHENSDVMTLTIVLKESLHDVEIIIQYFVYEDADIITRRVYLKNYEDGPVIIRKLMSGVLELTDNNYIITSFRGAWAREMEKCESSLTHGGSYIGGSRTGNSSADCNPFFFLRRPDTTEDNGNCYGMNLIYSGNHMEEAEVRSFGKLRVLWGIQSDGFSYQLDKGELFEAPEAVLVFSSNGLNDMSHKLHRFVKSYIIPEKWQNAVRPVLLNSWEAAYFKISEAKMLKLAKAGKKAGIELFVMDDGWFGERNDDSHSLGDWKPNLKKLPHGLKGIADSVNSMGMKFGIWVEPEMVSVNSRLYLEHPEWVLQYDAVNHAEGRNQRILDLVNPEVQQFIINSMSEVFSSANISYVKWDMNRNMSDIFSPYLAKKKRSQGKQFTVILKGCIVV